MEINSDIIGLSGVLLCLSKKVGEFTKIKFKGGNEQKILDVLQELHRFLENKNHLKDEKYSVVSKNQMEAITLLFVLNTEYKNQYYVEEFAQFNNVCAKLSKCLLANIIVGLNLMPYFCLVVEKLPLGLFEELLYEIVLSLRKTKAEQQLEDSYLILKTAAAQVTNKEISKEEKEAFDALSDHVPELLVNFSGIAVDPENANLNSERVQKHLGNTLKKLFDLLLLMDLKNSFLERFINHLLNTASCVAKCVTISVYCYWAELDEEEGQSLQAIIGGKAYLLIEKYKKYDPAIAFIQMIATFAVKPKTIREIILGSKLENIVNMVNKADSNQKLWYQALINNTELFKNENAKNCLLCWVQLCSVEDVSRLLKMSLVSGDKESQQIAVKCASSLDASQLILVTVRHFYENGFVVLNDNPQTQLVLIFNKLKDTTTLNDTLLLNILIQILQNPEFALVSIFTECIKNIFYISTLKDLFSAIKDILKINNLGVRCLNKVMEQSKPCEQNYKCYVKLFNTFIEKNYLSQNQIIMGVLFANLIKEEEKKELEDRKQILQILNGLSIKIALDNENDQLAVSLLKLLDENRCTFLTFDSQKQEVVQLIVNMICNQWSPGCITYTEVAFQNETEDSLFLNYYKDFLLGKTINKSLFHYLFSEVNFDNQPNGLCYLTQYMPSCVLKEWTDISLTIYNMLGFQTYLKLFHKFFILCQNLVKQQNEPALLHGFIYCIQNFSMVLKNTIIPKLTDLNDEVLLANAIVELIANIPEPIKQQEGLNLLGLMTERSLKNLGNKKEFVVKICLIKDVKLCQILAQKILS